MLLLQGLAGWSSPGFSRIRTIASGSCASKSSSFRLSMESNKASMSQPQSSLYLSLYRKILLELNSGSVEIEERQLWERCRLSASHKRARVDRCFSTPFKNRILSCFAPLLSLLIAVLSLTLLFYFVVTTVALESACVCLHILFTLIVQLMLMSILVLILGHD